jgi:hypothetical protein
MEILWSVVASLPSYPVLASSFRVSLSAGHIGEIAIFCASLADLRTGTDVALLLLRVSASRERIVQGQRMKNVWLGIIFFLIYGLLSMKIRAAENIQIEEAGSAGNHCRSCIRGQAG